MQNISDMLLELAKSQQVKEVEYCEHCNTPKHTHVNLMGNDLIVPCLCKCEIEKHEAEQEKVKRDSFLAKVKSLKHIGITEQQYYGYNFDSDDKINIKLTNLTKRYVDNFDEMLKKNFGLVFFGDVGTGKSFYACCIANALIEMGISSIIITAKRIINNYKKLDFCSEQNELIHSFSKPKLLIIDDLEIENLDDLGQDIILQVIDERNKNNKPLIVTTSSNPDQLEGVINLNQHKIFERINRSCIPIQVNDEGRKELTMRKKMDELNDILGIV